VKATVLNGTIYRGTKRYGPGQIADLDDDEAEKLIAAGFVSKPGDRPPSPPPPKTPEELAAEAAKRAKK
jgi:hypothetical protein